MITLLNALPIRAAQSEVVRCDDVHELNRKLSGVPAVNALNRLETERLAHLRVIAEIETELLNATASRAELEELQGERDALATDLRELDAELAQLRGNRADTSFRGLRSR